MAGMEGIVEKIGRYFSRWEWGVFDESGSGAVWRRAGGPEMLSYLRFENAQGRHIFMRPLEDAEPRFMLLDDLDAAAVARQHKDRHGWKPGRLVVETSPDNYQVWIKSDRALSLEEKRHWLTRCKSDPGAAPKARWGRAPGFRNHKAKYRDYSGKAPLSKLHWVDYGRTATIPPVTGLSPLPRGGRVSSPPLFQGRAADISRSDYDRGDESATDFAYALALFRRGAGPDQVRGAILTEREAWDNHKGDNRRDAYLARTLERAAAVVDGSPAMGGA